MDHGDAARTGAVERYLSHKLSAAEQDAFEEHFFSCLTCAAEVRLAAIFKANLRAVFLEARLKGDPAIQTAPAFGEIHPYLAVAGGEVCGAFSNAEAALDTARHRALDIDLERRRLDPHARATSFYVRDRRTGQQITERDLRAQGDKS